MTRSRAVADGLLFEELDRLLHRATYRGQLRPDRMDAPSRMVLRLIGSHGPLRSSEIAERASMSRPSASRYLAALEAAGLAVCRPDPRDGRAGLLSLTAAGHSQLGRIAQSGREAIHDATAGFTIEEVSTLSRLLGRFNDTADTRPTDRDPEDAHR